MSLRPFRDLAEAERAAAVASLRTVGGVYDLIALCVEHDYSAPVALESAHE